MFASALSPLHWIDRIPRDGGPSRRPVFIMLTSYPFTLMSLWLLPTFWLSSCSLGPLFSSSYKLFCKNTGGGVYYQSEFSFPHHRKRWLATWNGPFPAFVYGTNIDAPYHLC